MTPLLPLTLSWLGGIGLLILDGRRRYVSALALGLLACVLGLDLTLLIRGSEVPYTQITGGWPSGVGIRLFVDRTALLFASTCSLVATLVLLHESSRVQSRLFPALVVIMTAGLHGVFFTGDLFNFYVFFELAIVTSFALSAYGYGRTEIRGAFIYAAVNWLGSVLFLISVSLVYHAVGSLDMADIGRYATAGSDRLMPAAALLFASLSLKLGLFPFHGWLVVLYTHSRHGVAALMSGALVNVGAYGLVRLGNVVFGPALERASWVLLLLGCLAVIYGAVIAARRTAPVDIIAYSAIMQAGYVVLGVGLANRAGVAAALLMMVAGALDKTMMFLLLDAAPQVRQRLAVVATLGTAGLPLTAGFVAKLNLFSAAQSGAWPVAMSAVLLLSVCLSLLIVVRFLALVRRMPDQENTGSCWGAVVLAAVSVAIGVYPAPLDRDVATQAGDLAFEREVLDQTSTARRIPDSFTVANARQP